MTIRPDKRKLNDLDNVWEQEATRPHPPNAFAQAASVLDDQNEKLQHTCDLLEQKLATLKESLVDIEKQLCDENRHIDEQSILYDESLFTTIETAQSLIHPSQDGSAESASDLKTFLSMDDNVSSKIEHSLHELRGQLPFLRSSLAEDGNVADHVQATEARVDSFRRAELQYSKAQAACKGRKTMISSLENDFKKLNRLPQIMDILRNTTNVQKAEIKANRRAQRVLLQTRLEPLVSRLSDIMVREPLLLEQHAADKSQLLDYEAGLDELASLLIKQRALQQLANYACEARVDDCDQKRHTVRALLDDLGEQADKHQVQMAASHGNKNEEYARHADDDGLLRQIDLMLRQPYLEQANASRRRSFHEESILTKVNTLLQYEKRWKNRWEENMAASLDAAKLLEDTKNGLADAATSEHLGSPSQSVMTPAEHSLLQSEMELRTQDLKDAVDQLERELDGTDAIQDKKRLLSLFLTDPEKFGEEVSSTNATPAAAP